MTDEELKGALPDIPSALEIITTLRAQLAEARAERDIWEIDAKRNHQAAEIEFARANRAEAALAAQIEVDAGIAGCYDLSIMSSTEADARAQAIARHIRNQPHDRTALDRVVAESLAAQQEGFIDVVAYATKEAREKALLDAVDACRLYDAWGECRKAILALIEKPNAR